MADRNEDFNWYPLGLAGRLAWPTLLLIVSLWFPFLYHSPVQPPLLSLENDLPRPFLARLRSSALFVYRRALTKITARCRGAIALAHPYERHEHARPLNGYVIAITAARNRKQPREQGEESCLFWNN